MCINSKIQQKLEQKAALDAEIAKLEQLAASTVPVKNLVADLLKNYVEEAPEDLGTVWQEVLAIGAGYGLGVQTLAVQELWQWEAANRENERLREEARDNAIFWGEVKDKNKKLEEQLEEAQAEIAELRSQLRQVQTTPEAHQNITERALKLDRFCTQCVESNNFAGFIQEIQHIVQGNELPTPVGNEYDTCFEDDDNQNTIEPENTEAASDSIPALTLWQPWASLIQHEVKRIETRSWSTSYRGPIAIHAAKKPVYTGIPELLDLLPKGGEPPLGAVVAIANLVDCVEMTPEFIAQQSEQELKCGDWQPGRFAWVLEIIRPVVPPVPATGGQKLWNWSGTSIQAELQYLENLKTVPEYEPEESNDTVDSILEANGFFQPDADIPINWDTSELYEVYRGWDIFYSFPNGGIVAIGLNNSNSNQFWDASTEYIQEIEGNTFPESLDNYDEIATWTKQLIDQIVAATPVENLETPGQLTLPLKFPEVAAEEVLTDDEYDAAVEEELALDDDEEEPRKITVKSKDKKWTVEVTDNMKDGDSARISMLFQAKDEGFTYTLKSEELDQFPGTWADHVERILETRISTPVATDETEQVKLDNDVLDFEVMGLRAQIYSSHSGDKLVGVTFRFLSLEEKGADGKPKVVFSTSKLAAELSDVSYLNMARTLIQDWRDKETARKEKEANPYAKEEDKFVELVKISNAVGYLKRRDTGELLAGYAAFSNKDELGQQTPTKAKSRAQKWSDYLGGNYQASEDGKIFNWDTIKSKISDPRKSKRLVSDNPKLEFVYEIKFVGVPLDYLERVAKQDLSLLPGQAPETQTPPPAPVETVPYSSLPVFRVKVNSFEIASSRQEEIIRQRFEEELEELDDSKMSVTLLKGSELIESHRVANFEFVQVEDFDSANPEFQVNHLPWQLNFKVYRDIQSADDNAVVPSWRNSVYPYSQFSTRESAAVDAARRLHKAQSAE